MALRCCPPRLLAQGLYEQALARAVGVPAPGCDWLLLDLRGGRPLLDTFAPRPMPVGSLLKPFLALAYARSHTVFPTVLCRGHADQCWSVPGHGSMTLRDAIAHSCNAYFLTVARGLDPADIPYLPAPPRNPSPETLIGLTPAWPVAAPALARAYGALLNARATPALAALRAGMRLCATQGTAARLGEHAGGVLAKTGTAPCVDLPCRATGDGLAIAAVPLRQPTLLVLIRRRATNGATAAAEAGQLLSRLETVHAY